MIQRQDRALPSNPEKNLRAQPPPTTIAERQHELDDFTSYYNIVRPHRAVTRRTPLQAFTTRPKAFPTAYKLPPHYRVRHDRIDAAGIIILRYHSRLHHIGLSKRRRGIHVIVLIDDRDIRVLDRDTGQLICKLDPRPHPRLPPCGVKCGKSPENRLQV